MRARVYFEVVNQALTQRHRDEAEERLPAQLRTDPLACQTVRLAEPPVVDRYPAPCWCLARPADQRSAVALLHQEYAAFLDSRSLADSVYRTASLFLVLSLLSVLVVLYVVRFQAGLAQSLSKIVGICCLTLITLALAFLCNSSPYHAILVPLTVTALILTIAYNPQFALVMSLALTLAGLVGTSARMTDLLVALGDRPPPSWSCAASGRGPGWSRSEPSPALPTPP